MQGTNTLEGGSMVVVMQERATEEQIEKVVASLVEICLLYTSDAADEL